MKRFRHTPKNLLRQVLGLFYPEVCQVCGEEKASAGEYFVGENCQGKICGIERPFCECCGQPFRGEITVGFECPNCQGEGFHFRAARAAVELKGPVQAVIHGYKYNHCTWFEGLLAEWLVARAKPALAAQASGESREAAEAGVPGLGRGWDWIVPIPLHWLRRRERSFNQADRLAGYLSRATGIPARYGLLKRVAPTATQTRLSRAERLENVKGAFAWAGREGLNGARVVLVDDVLTTGATASACAKVLIENGAELVDVWTVARGVWT
jgi:ComF family protein